jgi:GAF domain-containing protein
MEQIEDLLRRLEQLNEIGSALSNERDTDALLEKILLAAKAITHADGGTLYCMDEAQKQLRFEILRTDSLGVAMGGTTGQPIAFPAAVAASCRRHAQPLDGCRLQCA